MRWEASAPFDVLLCDLGLPDGDGCDVVRGLIASRDGHATRTIAVTGHAYPQDVARSRAAGFEAHVVKPFDISELLRVVRVLTEVG